MAANNQFSIAVHLMAGLGFCTATDRTSAQLAASVNTSPSFIRRTLAKLSKAGLIETSKGKNGFCRLGKKPSEISLLDIYLAVEAPKAFSIHHYEETKPCQVSCNIKSVLEDALNKTQKGMEDSLAKISLCDLLSDIKKC
ncbi:Rrf2 family transcriptional regulator [Luteolibacter yonseiensis]|uniref:Rrf2 family transcriptional regulator n=1 Tax=Luteolibacter yonseiensis TaxID=1144680 RepID=A0A934R134_9BACT|nr:Rrf2 family transcriptional regulator [Luteolibacter yonseiensis]MBK1814547.1 Rrf2 family transcriptional regulator [Luteolibacter yonseiensis]